MIKFYKKIEESNKTKDKLFRIISHDLRSPFNSLLGTSDIQLKYIKNKDYDKIEATSRAINLASNKIYDLTQSLLEWSLSQTEQIVVKKTKFSLNESIIKVIDLCLITSKNKEVEIVFNPQFDIEVNLDYTMFQIVLRNIIMNSVIFSFRGQSIVVETSKEKDNIVINVRDFGVGMDEEQLNNIFSPHKYKTTIGTEKEKGTGLGLLISKELIEKQGGTIQIQSNKDEGTIVTISLPIE
ncbi:MAG: HAMP domain-containing sensor histidine kinase [Bacteroidales bacterium]